MKPKKQEYYTEASNTRISKEFKAGFDELCKELGKRPSEFSRECLELGVGLGKEGWGQLYDLSERFKIPFPIIQANIDIKYNTDLIVQQDLDPDFKYSPDEFFPDLDGNPITGRELFDKLYRKAVEKRFMEAASAVDVSDEESDNLLKKYVGITKKYKEILKNDGQAAASAFFRNSYYPPEKSPKEELAPEQQAVLDRASAHDRKCKEIAKEQGEEAALEYHRKHKSDAKPGADNG